MKIETTLLHGGYSPKNGEPGQLPIYQSTTYKYDSSEYVQKLFDLTAPGHMYSRISNPTVECVEKKINALEGGVGALCTTSGQAAVLLSVLNIASAGDSIVCSSSIYGGTYNLFGTTLKRFGIETIFVDSTTDEIFSAIRPNTKLVFAESISNPQLVVLDIEKFARAAHSHNIPLIIDNTFATPVLLNPFKYGADIIVHSTTKYMDGHAVQIGGAIVDSGNFDWSGFDLLTKPDDSYHGIVYTHDFGSAAYINKARVQLMRDFGVYPSAINAFFLNLGLETLALRMERHCYNAQKVAEHLSAHEKVEFVRYPGLEGDPFNSLAKKYLPHGTSGVISFSIKGSRENAIRFIDSLKLATLEVHVADIHTCVLHPASSTHRQLTDEQLRETGITPGLIRLSVGLEHIDDILEDLDQALKA